MAKTISLWSIIGTLLLLAMACDPEEPRPDPKLILSFEEVFFSHEGEAQEVEVNANLPWQASSSETWCTLSAPSGEAGVAQLAINVAANTGAESRSATITVSIDQVTKNITVTQAGAEVLQLSDSEMEIGENGGEYTLGVTASGIFEIETSPTWLTVSATSQQELQIQAKRNPVLAAREGIVRLKLGGVVQEVTVVQSGQALQVAPDKMGMELDALPLADQILLGWNLGNTLEAASSPEVAGETLWGNPMASQALIDAVKNAGFNAVRIPCAWSGYIEDRETHRLSTAWINRVQEVVDYCMNNDMYAIINIHWDGGWLEENPTYDKQEEVNVKMKALWEQIAVAFRDYDQRLLFAGTNEVRKDYGTPTSEYIEVQQSFNQTFVDAVRSTGGKNSWRNIVVQAYNTNIEHAHNFLELPQDPTPNRKMVEVHYYDPWDFALDGNSNKYLWGKDYEGSANASGWGQEAWVDQMFGLMKSDFVDKGIPVVLGEYGAILRSSLLSVALENHKKARNHYLHYVTKSAMEHGLIPFYWDNGHTGNNGFGLFNRHTTAIVQADAVEAIVSSLD
ncbi:cellulase family glycosylhydrolase [Belliella marina]|uniref:Cellulase family glycosylhydrolase n=1 Tax=Belliella marina TaxID=1644146 RepID=A0ABW4VG13_9BACT